jgi:hypothetical protein
MSGVTQINFSAEELRKRLRAMPDPELLRYGQAARYMASPQANYGKPLVIYIVQLQEARREWRRRHPKLPLKISICMH